ncbi:MAG: hypothetical protein Q9184_005421 [Pyrenodesmia sp. 2 TL-2023]
MPALYDTFLVQEPLRQDPFAVTHNPHDTATLIDVYRKSILYFEERSRRRAVERLQYELGLLYVQQGEWKKALRVLEPLWRNATWRREGWWAILGGLVERVKECAVRCGDAETVVKGSWEGMSSGFNPSLEENYDFSKCLDKIRDLAERPKVTVKADELVPCLSFTFQFCAIEGNVGEPLTAELTVASHASISTASISLDQVLIAFEGGQKHIVIGRNPNMEADNSDFHSGNIEWYSFHVSTAAGTQADEITESSPEDLGLLGTSNLRFRAGTTRIFSFEMFPRESGVVRVANITSTINTKKFDFKYVVTGDDLMRQDTYWQRTSKGFKRIPAGNHALNEIRIHPKPPKMRIKIPDFKKDYFTDENVTLDIKITNEEDEDADVTIEARFLGQADAVPTLIWTAEAQPSTSSADPLNEHKQKPISSRHLGHIEKSESRTINLTLEAKPVATEAVLEIKASYYLLTEPDTPISKVLVNEVIFDRPFEANYDFQPSIDPFPMPNYFQCTENTDSKSVATGLRQQWNSTVRLASFASESLIIKDLTLEPIGVHEGAICQISRVSSEPTAETIVVASNDFYESQFELHAQKVDLDDRRSTTFQFQLSVRWRRNHPDAPLATTILPTPDLTIPFGEPRVLASVQPSPQQANDGPEFIPISYTIENPSTHVLNFDISMETSDEFAFSGPKMTTLQLVPVSRHTVKYHIVPLVRGKWITPDLKVLDTHFQQVLRVHGTGGMRSDKRGASVWVDAEE